MDCMKYLDLQGDRTTSSTADVKEDEIKGVDSFKWFDTNVN